MRKAKIAPSLALGLLLLTAGCGAITKTEKRMLDWGTALNTYLTTNAEAGYEFPEQLGQLDPTFLAMLDINDGWGNPFHYRKIRDDKYQLISSGPDGTAGNEDDLVLANGIFYDAAEIYAETPWGKR